MKKFLKFPRQSWLRMFLLLAACWALAFLGPLSYLVLVAVPLALWRAWCERARVALALGLDEAEKIHTPNLAKAGRKATPNSGTGPVRPAPSGGWTAR